MSETTFTDQRPRTTHAEIPEKLRAIKTLPPDPELQAFIAKIRERFERRLTERRAS